MSSPRYRRPAAWRKAKEAFDPGDRTRLAMERLEHWAGMDPRHYLAVAIHHFLSLDRRGRWYAIAQYNRDHDRRPADVKLAFPEACPPLATLAVRGRTWAITIARGKLVVEGEQCNAAVLHDPGSQEIIFTLHASSDAIGRAVLEAINHSLPVVKCGSG